MKFSMTALIASATFGMMTSALPSAHTNELGVTGAVARAADAANVQSTTSSNQETNVSEYAKVYSSLESIDYASYIQQGLAAIHEATSQQNVNKVQSYQDAVNLAGKYVGQTDLNAKVTAGLKMLDSAVQSTDFNKLASQGVSYTKAKASSYDFNNLASIAVKIAGSLNGVVSLGGLKSKLTSAFLNYFI